MMHRILLCILIVSLSLMAKPLPITEAAPATLGEKTATYADLITLPQPREKIIAAVYKFTDQTGQYKTSNSSQSWSTAVTQGATSLLVKALEDSKWFIPVEREGLANLLNERKIINATRENYAKETGTQAAALPPLLYAGIILEGGIISYESNIVTEGFGGRYFGLGGNFHAQKDQVTVYLRAISTKTGQVLKTVHASKTIFSKMLNAGAYLFISYKRLLEVETGISSNEPPQLCVREAIEKAVISLVVEGLRDSLWLLQDPADSTAGVISAYWDEKKFIPLPQKQLQAMTNRNHIQGVIGIGGQIPHGTAHNSIEPIGFLGVQYCFDPQLYLRATMHGGRVTDVATFNGRVLSFDLMTMSDFLPSKPISITGGVGISAVKAWVDDINGHRIKRPEKYLLGFDPAVVTTIGSRVWAKEAMSLFAEIQNHLLVDNTLDNKERKSATKSYWTAHLGISYMFEVQN
ncbi:MAG: hypothetical protein JW795_06145 [Chitinivibrionales bacterium]|nr:hypothetical protein [Chitinivibrionales bacterium]